MKRFWENYMEHNIPFHILAFISVALLVASWIWPPTAVIDASVLAGTGELIGWGALYTVLRAIEKGKTATITHGQTSVTIGKEAEEEDISEEV